MSQMSDRSFAPRLGARILEEEEITLSLPTYSKLLDQIETIRRNVSNNSEGATGGDTKENGDSQNAFVRPQVTNSLSILGPRGSGKSSILKTLYRRLEKDNEKNILLPPIVPENLENHMTLMASLLGLLNDQVIQLTKSFEKQKSSCPIVCPSEKNPLEREYRELVKYYVHLQKSYQDISIQKYSTESDYVRTMTEVFEAGNQFSQKFWTFIDHLLKRYENDLLLFVFIDDIDLSTHRCADVVRTLLGYLSHPRVVIILAGDIEIFGEALTLDFLRQEELLGKNGIQKSYTVSQKSSENVKSLLERKKELAYEYLKKVMPPANRYSICIWTLNNRGKFCPVGLYNSANKNSALSLQALLANISQQCPLLNGYFSAPGEGPNQVIYDRILYHLFDSTARGLINAYIALEQLSDQRESGEYPFKNIQSVLETIVFSKSNLNALQDLIFSRFLQLGADRSSSHVFFNNFNDWTNQQLPYIASGKSGGEQVPVNIAQELLVFQIFVYLDWATRLLGKSDILESKDYQTAKINAQFLLCSNGAISEKTDLLPVFERVRLYQLCTSRPNLSKTCDNGPAIALHCFFNLSFPLAIQYFSSLNIPSMLKMIDKSVNSSLENLHLAVDFINTLNRFFSNDLSKASVCLAKHPRMLEFIEEQLGSGPVVKLVSMICDPYFKNRERTSLGKKKEMFSPLYNLYCKNDITLTIPTGYQNAYRISCASEIKTQINLNGYFDSFRSEYISDETYNIRNDFLKAIKEINKNFDFIPAPESPRSAEDIFVQCWSSLFAKNNDSFVAIPFYNFYAKQIWQQVSDKNYHLKFLRDTYEDRFQLVELLHNSNPKLEQESLEKQIKILFSIDSNGLWTQSIHDKKEDESPIGQIKAYILKQLVSSEERLVDHWGLLSETNNNDNTIKGSSQPLIVVNGASAAFEQLKNGNTGGYRTLAKYCIGALKTIFERADPSRMTVVEYIYAQCVLRRLIYSNAWYGKAEARRLLSVLEQATLNIYVDYDPHELKRYTFWFHCYCRYRMAELSGEIYSLVEQLHSDMNLIQKAGEKLDQQGKEYYYDMMHERGRLEDELIRQIPDLFNV